MSGSKNTQKTRSFSLRKFGFYIIGFIALTVFIIKIIIHYSTLSGVTLEFTNVFIAILPFLFGIAILFIVSFKGPLKNLILFILSVILAYMIIVPVYLAGL